MQIDYPLAKTIHLKKHDIKVKPHSDSANMLVILTYAINPILAPGLDSSPHKSKHEIAQAVPPHFCAPYHREVVASISRRPAALKHTKEAYSCQTTDPWPMYSHD